MPGTHIFSPLPGPPSPDLDNAVAITKLFADSGPDTTVLLLPRTLYVCYTSINYIHNGNTLATLGYPSCLPDCEDAQAIIETRGEGESTAVNMLNLSNVSLRRIHIRGLRGWGRANPSKEEAAILKREAGAMGWLEGGGALVLIGGPEGRDSIIEGCRLADPRGWSACHVVDFAERISLVSNLIGPSGQEAPDGPWADGISIAGRDSFITNNTIIDATDGAIVIFCAPGSTVIANKIISRNRDLLGAINLVDEFPFSCDFTNTRVIANEIFTEGDAFIHLGIGIGSTCWAPFTPEQKMNYGGTVTNNIIGPGTLGFGIALSTAKDFTVLSNTICPGTTFRGDNIAALDSAPPLPLLADRNRIENCVLQDDFVEANGSYLIGIKNGFSKSIRFKNGQINLDSGREGIELDGAIFRLDDNSQLIVQELFKDGQQGNILWSSSGTESSGGSRVTFDKEGQFMIVSSEDNRILWSPADYTLSSDADSTAQSSLRLSSTSPYITLKDASNNLIYASSYEFNREGFGLDGGDWISIAPPSLGGTHKSRHPLGDPQVPDNPKALGRFNNLMKDFSKASLLSIPPVIPPRPSNLTMSTVPLQVTYLFISPITAQIILHSSPSPSEPIDSAIHWSSPLVSSPFSIVNSGLRFQGDGNLVLYVDREECGQKAEWASGSNGHENAGWIVSLSGVSEHGGASMKILDKHKSVVWQT